jgi:hypothetical protein
VFFYIFLTEAVLFRAGGKNMDQYGDHGTKAAYQEPSRLGSDQPKPFPRWGAKRKKKPNDLAFSAERRCGCTAAAGFSTEGRKDG